MDSTVKIDTIGDLRRALEGLPDERPIVSQVVAGDGCVWNMRAEFTPNALPLWDHGGAVVTLSHPELKTLPKG